MKSCPRCGFINDDSAKFCKQCGQKLDMLQKESINNCPHCGKELPKEAIFCKYCGIQVKQTQKQHNNQKPSKEKERPIIIPILILGLSFIVVVIAVIFFIILSSSDSRKNDTSGNSRQNYAIKNEDYEEEDNNESYTVSDQINPEFKVYSDTKENYANALQPENYQYYDSGMTDFSFYYPDNLYCDVTTVENEDCEYGYLIKKIEFGGSNDSKLIYRLIRRTDSLSLEEETNYIYNKEVANLYENEDIVFSTKENYGKVIVTGWDSTYKNYAIYDFCKIENDYILQMKVIFPDYTSDLDKAQKGYVTECYYRLCGFSDTTLEVRSYEEYLDEN